RWRRPPARSGRPAGLPPPCRRPAGWRLRARCVSAPPVPRRPCRWLRPGRAVPPGCGPYHTGPGQAPAAPPATRRPRYVSGLWCRNPVRSFRSYYLLTFLEESKQRTFTQNRTCVRFLLEFLGSFFAKKERLRIPHAAVRPAGDRRAVKFVVGHVMVV